jgi:palmitoyl-protein thioesterase
MARRGLAACLAAAAAFAAAAPATAARPARPQPPLPVVFWHGLGDTCCAPWSLGALAGDVRDALGRGSYVLSLDTGGGRGAAVDAASGVLGELDAQVAAACATIAGDARIAAAGAFNAVGFSQGGLFLRAVAQRCSPTARPVPCPPAPRMATLVTLGAPHAGAAAPPACAPPASSNSTAVCALVEAALGAGAYSALAQATVVQVQRRGGVRRAG